MLVFASLLGLVDVSASYHSTSPPNSRRILILSYKYASVLSSEPKLHARRWSVMCLTSGRAGPLSVSICSLSFLYERLLGHDVLCCSAVLARPYALLVRPKIVIHLPHSSRLPIMLVILDPISHMHGLILLQYLYLLRPFPLTFRSLRLSTPEPLQRTTA